MKKILLIVLSLAILFSSSVAGAKYKELFKVEYTKLWSTVVRFVRVDKDWEIIDKDKENGYLIFTHRDIKGNEKKGSIEFIKRKFGKDSTREAYDLLINIRGASSVDERMIITDLKKKLHSE